MPNDLEHSLGDAERRVASLRRGRDLIPLLVLLTIVAVAAVALALAPSGADIATLAAASTGLLLLLAITRLPANTEVWRAGADGASQTSLILAPLEAAGWFVLRDRRVPASRATIDHVAIGPSGVWVIETKSWHGRLLIRAGETWLDSVPSPAAARAVRTAAAIAGAAAAELQALGVTARPVLCFHRARLPLFRRAAGGVAITDGRRLIRLLSSSPRVCDDEAVRSLAVVLEEALTPQVHAAGK